MHFNEPIIFETAHSTGGERIIDSCLPFNRTYGCSFAQEWGSGSAWRHNLLKKQTGPGDPMRLYMDYCV